MNIRYLLLTLSGIAVASLCAFGQNKAVNDTTKNIKQKTTKVSMRDSVRQLSEVVVKSNSVVRRGDTLLLYPSQRDKSFAAGAVDVLANMNLPEVIVDPLSGAVTSSDGEPIALFIDFQPASGQQLSDVRPQDILRVDILRSPSDPRFNGARVVANYIMKKYEYGGYTKLKGVQNFPVFYGKYDLYSKFSYKKMTYDVSAGLGYNRYGDNMGSESHSLYKFENTEIERVSKTTSYLSRQLRPRVSARAVYNAPGISIANTVGFNFSKQRPFEQEGEVRFSDIFESSKSRRVSSRYSRSAAWNGNYYFRLQRGWSLNFDGGFNWGDNSDNSTYTLSGNAPIVNDISETILNGYGQFTLSKQLKNHNLNIDGSGGWTRNKLAYRSSGNNGVYYREGYGQIGGQLGLRFNGFMIDPSVKFSISSQRVNDRVDTKFLPKSFIPFYIQLTKRSSLDGSFEFAMGGADIAQRSPVLVQSNEIDAVRGNEDLGNYQFYNARLGYSHYLGPWLSIRLDALFTCNDNMIEPVYNPIYPEGGTPIMVRDVINGGRVCNTSLRLSLSGKYFDNKLSVNLSGSVNYYSQSGHTVRDEWIPSFWASASYYLGNFRLNAYFTPANRLYSVWSDRKTPLYWYLGASYAYKDLFINVRFSNPFVKSYINRWRDINTDNYSLQETSFSPSYHQYVQVTLTYSFGYGKKLNRRDEVSAVGGAESIILK